MAFADGEHQRGLLELRIACVEHGTAVEQQGDRINLAVARGRHESGLTRRRRGIRIGSRRQQRVDQRCAAVFGREIQGRDIVGISRARVGAGFEQ